MQLRSLLKRLLYGAHPFYRGSFPYFGHPVYFSCGSHIFLRACAEGVYERQTTNLLLSLAKPHTTFIDVGANIGLLSVPILVQKSDVEIVSIEASPHTVTYLRKTWEQSPFRDRWKIIEAAISHTSGTAQFWVSAPENSAFDGLGDTKRGGLKRAVPIKVKTLDQIWRDLKYPSVSVVKIDVEGGERDVLTGAHEMITRERPALVIEWNPLNLPAYGIRQDALLDICREMNYQAYAYPNLCLLDNELILAAAMAQTETFLLLAAHT